MTDLTAGNTPRPLGSGYLLESIIGAGAMGQVWRGATRQGEPVAIKVLRSELASDPAFVARFLQEAQILTRLTDPHLVRVRDLVAENSNLAIVMDLVPGPDLRAELSRRGTFRPTDAVAIIDGVLAGLTAVHAADVVHRDIKPENILLANPEGGELDPRLTDFGVSRIVEQGARSTTVIGTPEYIAPEVADGSIPLPASDLYSVGIVLYELLTGVTPFSGGSPLAVMRRHVEQQPGRPDGVPDQLWRVITALLGKNPAQRPKGAPEARSLLAAASVELADLPALPKLDAAPAFVAVSQPTVMGARVDLEQPDYAAAAATGGRSTRRRNLLIAAAAAVALILAGAAVAVATGGSKQNSANSATVATTASATDTATSTDSASATGAPTSAAAGTSVPSVVGKTLGEATTAIQNAGLSVTTKEVLNNDKADNTVVAQDPAGGMADPSGSVTLTVARQSVGAFLADMAPVQISDQNIQTSTVTMNGVPYAHAISAALPCNNGSATTESYQYDLGRHFRNLTSKVGLTDDSDNTAHVLLEVVVDGRKVFSKTTTLGKPVALSVDVTGVLRLQIDATIINSGCPSNASTAVWADAELFGTPDEVPTPTDSATPTDTPS
jgi:Protein kinase domain/NPCBM/NEW2 domain/PASTA domain